MVTFTRVQSVIMDAVQNPLSGSFEYGLNFPAYDTDNNLHTRDRISIVLGSIAAGVVNQSTGSNDGTTLNDTARNWATNIWKNATVTILSGTGAGQTRTISSNTATQLTVSSTWTTIPGADSVYGINGAFDLQFIPNSSLTPANSAYSLAVTNSGTGTRSIFGYMIVPTSASPVALSSIIRSAISVSDITNFVSTLIANDDLTQITQLGNDFHICISPYSQGTHSGLNFSYNAGRIRSNNTIVSTPAGVVLLTTSLYSNYIEVDPATGIVSANLTGFTAGRIPLYTAIAGATQITSITDQRCIMDFSGNSLYQTYVYNQASADGTWTIVHNLGTTNLLVTVWDNSSPPVMIIPGTATETDSNTLTLTFSPAKAGKAVVVAVK